MKRSFALNRVCILTAVACLSLAYILAGYWLILPAFLAMALFWIISKRWSVFRSSSALLSMFVSLAAIGITLNLFMTLILIACTAALAGWDLTNFVESQAGNQRPETHMPLERFHLRALAIAVSAGSIVAFLSAYASIRIPFGVTLLLVLIAIGGLTYALQSLGKNL